MVWSSTHVSVSHLLDVRGWEQGAWGRSDTDGLSVLGAHTNFIRQGCGCAYCTEVPVLVPQERRSVLHGQRTSLRVVMGMYVRVRAETRLGFGCALRCAVMCTGLLQLL